MGWCGWFVFPRKGARAPKITSQRSKTDLAVSTDFQAPLQSSLSAEFLRVPYSSSNLQRPELPGLRMQPQPRLRYNRSLPSTCQIPSNGVFLSSALMTTSASRRVCRPRSPNIHTLGSSFSKGSMLWAL